ncbi:hypothetical protein AVEN_260812-1 [Araneus ventricosus]|uniref:Uncharacterized protein n=1 Tax=Araneus ventricosus TaxID=182803 RepID=A0A4Y2FAA7_ARAVE|nr:hypothetical protein AVEN_260812-1 [Araneus ventricosus]
MGIALQKDDSITQHAKAFVWDAFTIAQCLFPFSEIIKNTYLELSSYLELGSLQNSDGTAAENWLNGQGRDFYQAGLNKLVLRSDKCLKRFGDYMVE